MDAETRRYEVLPLPDHQASFRFDGRERLRWHFGSQYPRPFFYPLTGPSGQPLTRMGHPGAPNHDHHQSIWFAHHKVLGVDFWGNGGPARIRQKQWLAYQDDADAAVMAVLLGWYDGHDPRELLEQELIVSVRATDEGETLVEFQTTFRPVSESLEFGQTNFGFLAVRVAKSISEHFGGGQLTSSEGGVGEAAIFGRPAQWVDYSGPIVTRLDGAPRTATEGITYFDHPRNPRHPTLWHVRADGWMGASVCLREPIVTTRQQPLTLRYLLHAHRGGVNSDRAETVARDFAQRSASVLSRSTKPHLMYEVTRER